ncbi:sigma-70 family RNA polymerase sigma factor [Shinella zoogloeoides]|uniref:sigma-70 family RNA polymerase sigma factor n=1 Tax=Shinella zoogloeoides TaxID=352475 RepID=UPI00299E6AA3|nr:sigma-70 family RNA polymerase sigma factor [Shinella zoogloeoides]WPE19933.1 RNA polymerase sigma factor RpoH [Shinella zoogloeoides]
MRTPKYRFLTLEEEKTASVEQLVLSHRPLVMHIARNFSRYGADIEDLRQEGNIGLMIAASRFDPSKGYRFSTYAFWWVRTFMRDAVIQSHSVVGHSMSNDAKRNFFKGRAHRDVSTEHRVSEAGLTVGDTLVCPQPAPDELVFEILEAERATKAVRRAMRALKPREREIVTVRHMREPKEGLESIGNRLGISKERVRQIEARAFSKLRDCLLDFQRSRAF